MVAGLLAGACQPERHVAPPRSSTQAPQGLIVPSRSCNGTFIVEATINDVGPFNMLVDTGTTDIVLSPEGAKRLDRWRLSFIDDKAAKPNYLRESSAQVKSIRVGGADLAPRPVSEIDLGGISEVLGERIDGILGYRAFSGWLLTIDYRSKQVRLESGPLEPSAETMPIWMSNSGLPVTEILVAGKPLTVVIDSGASGGLIIHDIEELAIASEWRDIGSAYTVFGSKPVRSAILDGEVQVGGIREANPVVLHSDKVPTVGIALMQLAVWTFDQKSNIARVQVTSGARTPSPGVGLAVHPAPTGFRVTGVLFNGPAWGKVVVGDLIVRVNGRAADELKCEGIRSALPPSGSVAVGIKRGDREFEVLLDVVDNLR